MLTRRLVILALLLLPAPVHAQRLRIVVGGANFRPYPIAVPETIVTGGNAAVAKKITRELDTVLRFDVDLARALELVPPKTYLDPEHDSWTKPEYANWVNVGASGLLRAGVHVGDKEAKITYRFYDVIAQREILTRTYEVPPSETESTAPRFVDEVVELLTGEAGIFTSRIAFIKRTGKGKALFVSDIDGRNVRRLTAPDDLSLLPAWGPSTRYVLFTSYLKNNPDLYRIDLSNNNLEWLSSRRGLNTGADVSPDGRRIAFTLSIDGNTEIYAMDWNGENLRRLTDSWGQDVSPTWSPDGTRIAFVSSRSGNPHLYTMGADGSSPKRLTFLGNYNQEPDWSPRPDGQICFTARDERLRFDIFLVHPESGVITRLTQDEGNNESPSFSPDGHHIVFTSTRGGGEGKHLYVMDADGTNQRRISREAGEYETPAWGPRRESK